MILSSPSTVLTLAAAEPNSRSARTTTDDRSCERYRVWPCHSAPAPPGLTENKPCGYSGSTTKDFRLAGFSSAVTDLVQADIEGQGEAEVEAVGLKGYRCRVKPGSRCQEPESPTFVRGRGGQRLEHVGGDSHALPAASGCTQEESNRIVSPVDGTARHSDKGMPVAGRDPPGLGPPESWARLSLAEVR